MMVGNLFWIILFGLIIYMVMKKGGGCCGGHDHGDQNDHQGHGGQHGRSLPPSDHHSRKIVHDNEKDPVCGMAVTGTSAGSEYRGRTYRFCSDQCRKLFELNPGKYASFQKT